MFRKAALFVAVILMAASPATATPPVEPPGVIVTAPGSYLTTYLPPAAAAFQGGDLTYVNADAAPHDVVSTAVGPDTQPWCSAYNPGGCPLFWSALITAGRTTPVLGLENTVGATVYDFYCSIHPNMKGKLLVSPRP